MSRSYETVFIVKPDLSEDDTKAVIEKFKNLIETSAKLDKVDQWGKKKFAYPIQKFTEGHYILMEFTSEPSFPRELERIYKITDSVLKYLVVKK
jgi:small subunit ribosomal protein S6